MTILTPDHWNSETQSLAEKLARAQAVDVRDHALLAIATELADLRKVLGPQTYTQVIAETLDRMGSDSSIPAELMPQEHETSGFALHRKMPEQERTAFDLMNIIDNRANIRQVGWYCPGGHPVESTRGVIGATAKANLKFDDPCEHGVPVYVLVRSDD